jgi:hypothetical protein
MCVVSRVLQFAAPDAVWPATLHVAAGVRAAAAVNLLRRFYVQENPSAPTARSKQRRQLKLLHEAADAVASSPM